MNEMIQEIITYLIITGTSLYAFYQTVLFFTPSKNKSACSGCSGNCGVKSDVIPNKKHILIKLKA